MISDLISNYYMYIDLVELSYTYDLVTSSCPVYSLNESVKIAHTVYMSSDFGINKKCKQLGKTRNYVLSIVMNTKYILLNMICIDQN